MSAEMPTDALEALRARLERGGGDAVDALAGVLDDLGEAASALGLVELVRLCRVARAALRGIVDDPDAFERHRDRILGHVDAVVGFAAGLMVEAADDVPRAPALLSLPNAEDEAHYRQTLALFAANAGRRVDELEAHALATEAGADVDAARDGARRVVAALEAELDVLHLREARDLCHAALRGFDAGRARGDAFPVDVTLGLVDWLHGYFAALGADATALPPPHAGLRDRLSALRRRRPAPPPPATAAPAVEAAEAADAGAGAGVDDAGDGGDDAAQPVVASTAPPPPPPQPVAAAARSDSAFAVGGAELEHLVDRVGDLVVAGSMLLQDPTVQTCGDPGLLRRVRRVDELAREVQAVVLSLRTTTLHATFAELAELVASTAAAAGKPVQLFRHGEDTVVDCAVAARLQAPLGLLLRRAVERGVEAPAARRAARKDPVARLSLVAWRQGGSVRIEVRDDGGGRDDQDPASAGGDDLALVRRAIASLRGKLEVERARGNGTTFRLRVPQTLAALDGMVLRVGRERFVVPRLDVEQGLRPLVADLHDGGNGREWVRVRGDAVPLLRLKDRFGLGEGEEDLGRGIVVVVEAGGRRCGLFADEIVGLQPVAIRPIDAHLGLGLGDTGDRDPVAASAILGDGHAARLLDTALLVELAAAPDGDPAEAARR